MAWIETLKQGRLSVLHCNCQVLPSLNKLIYLFTVVLISVRNTVAVFKLEPSNIFFIQGVQSPTHLLQHRSLLILNHVTKMLVSKRLASDRQLFRQV
jgi:hypothetical protein